MAEIPNRTLSRGLKMLEMLSQNPDGLALFELAQAMELPRSTAFNLARTLTDLDYVWFNAETNRYTLGLKMFEVGSMAIQRIDILSVIRSCMTEINQQINETMHLGIRTERDVLYIDKMESTRSIRMTSYVGRRVPMYTTALGKAILAGLKDNYVGALYRTTEFNAQTKRTISSRQELLRQLALIRERGYAIERDESVQGISCAAVALNDHQGQPMYAISVSVPSFRVTEMDLERYGRMLLAAKEKIERFSRAAQVTFPKEPEEI